MSSATPVPYPNFNLKSAVFEYLCLGKKFLVYNLVSRNLKVKYRRSVLGVLWTLVSPLGMAAVYYFVFKVILNIQVPHYLVLILCGVLPWAFFSQSLMEGMDSIVGNFGLLSKVPVPPQIFPFVGSVTNLVTLALSLPIVLGAALFSDAPVGASLMLILPLFGALFFVTYSLALTFALLYAYLRDLKHLIGIVLQIWFYGTPVLYQESQIPEKYRWILFANPLGGFFSSFHSIWVRGEWPSISMLGSVIVWTLFLVALSILIQQTMRHEIVENL